MFKIHRFHRFILSTEEDTSDWITGKQIPCFCYRHPSLIITQYPWSGEMTQKITEHANIVYLFSFLIWSITNSISFNIILRHEAYNLLFSLLLLLFRNILLRRVTFAVSLSTFLVRHFISSSMSCSKAALCWPTWVEWCRAVPLFALHARSASTHVRWLANQGCMDYVHLVGQFFIFCACHANIQPIRILWLTLFVVVHSWRWYHPTCYSILNSWHLFSSSNILLLIVAGCMYVPLLLLARLPIFISSFFHIRFHYHRERKNDLPWNINYHLQCHTLNEAALKKYF